MSNPSGECSAQWTNPGDILSLLLLVGGDVVQKAIAQLVGQRLCLSRRGRWGLPIVPVAFSFGWAAYGFTMLLAAVGSMHLMPTADHPSIVVNCSNGFVRETRSWVVGRLFRDHEIRSSVDPRPTEEGGRAESLHIDIFHLEPPTTPSRDLVWWSGWVVLLVQIGIASVPWAFYGDWGWMLVALCGIALVAMTCAMPQWAQEKWPMRRLKRQKVTCIARGNGYPHVMVLIGLPDSWDFESLATAISNPRPETRWISLVLAVLWTCLLICISGHQEHTWFLVGIGGLGMLQNVFAAGTPRTPGASNFHLTPFSRAPTIIGRREDYQDDEDADVDLEDLNKELAGLEQWVSGQSLEKPDWIESISKQYGVPAWLEVRPPTSNNPDSTKHSTAKGSLYATSRSQQPACSEKARVIHAPGGVHGALMEFEKWVPTAGLAMVQILFPGGLAYNDASIRDNTHKKFWRKAYHTASTRRRIGTWDMLQWTARVVSIPCTS